MAPERPGKSVEYILNFETHLDNLCVLNVYNSLTPTLSLGSSFQSTVGTKVIFAKSVWSSLMDLVNLASREYTIFPSAPLKEGGIFLKDDDMSPDESRFLCGCFMDIL